MPNRGDRPFAAAGPPVSVTVPGRPAPPAPVEPARTPSRRPAVVVLLVLVLVLVTLGVRDHRRAVQDRGARAAAALRIRVVATLSDPLVAGQRGAPVQEGLATLVLHNDSGVSAHIVGADVNGDQPSSTGRGTLLASGHTVVLRVGWRVRCAEIGTLAGPHLLDLRVRLAADTTYPLQVRLPPELTNSEFHAAAVRACDVLVDQ